MIRKIWKSSILVMLSMMTAYMPASACIAIPLPEFNRVDTVFWDAANQPTDQRFPSEFLGEVIFAERSGFERFFSSNKNKLKAIVTESPTHPDLVGKNLLIITTIDMDTSGLCPPSEPGKIIHPLEGAQGAVRGALSPKAKAPTAINFIYHSYRLPTQSGEL